MFSPQKGSGVYGRSRRNQAISHTSAGVLGKKKKQHQMCACQSEGAVEIDGCFLRRCGHGSGRDRLVVKERPCPLSPALLRARRRLVRGIGAGEVPQVCPPQQHTASAL